MAKVFRIHKEGSGNIIDWQESHSYGDNVIKQRSVWCKGDEGDNFYTITVLKD